jgi:hypothetical protein
VLTQRRFRTHVNVGRHGAIPSRNTILKWVKNFRTTGSVSSGTGYMVYLLGVRFFNALKVMSKIVTKQP